MESTRNELKHNPHLYAMSLWDALPRPHVDFLNYMKDTLQFEPKVIYDIGACVLHWTKEAKKIWPKSQIVLFDAMDATEFLYQDHLYHVGLLSNEDGNPLKFYENLIEPGGNSYYKENNDIIFPENVYIEKKSQKLDTVVAQKRFPVPDLVKIDVQGAETDVIKGALETFKSAKYLIVEMQCVDYNRGAPKVDVTLPFIESLGWKCIARKFSDNGADADYCFQNTRTKIE